MFKHKKQITSGAGGLIGIVLFLMVFAACTSENTQSTITETSPFEQEAKKLLAQMSFEEKLKQIIAYIPEQDTIDSFAYSFGGLVTFPGHSQIQNFKKTPISPLFLADWDALSLNQDFFPTAQTLAAIPSDSLSETWLHLAIENLMCNGTHAVFSSIKGYPNDSSGYPSYQIGRDSNLIEKQINLLIRALEKHGLISFFTNTVQHGSVSQSSPIRFSPILDPQNDSIAEFINALADNYQVLRIKNPSKDFITHFAGLILQNETIRHYVENNALHFLTARLTLKRKKQAQSSPYSTSKIHAVALDGATNSLILLRNEGSRVPIKNIHKQQIASLSIGAYAKTPFQKMLDRYTPNLNQYHLGIAPKKAELNQKLYQLAKCHYAIVALHGIRTTENTLSAEVIEFLEKLDQKTKLIVVNFGSISRLEALPELNCVLQAHQNQDFMQEVAAQTLFGGYGNLKGKLPYSLNSHFCKGDGISTGEPIRVQYSIPEAAGLNSEVLATIDSIAEAGISLGAFPGCQVFVARKGKIIYDKAFGYHSYRKRQKVRTDDLYDLASITKVAASTFAIMQAYEERKVHLNKTLATYLPEMDSVKIKNISITELLTHRAGLPPSLPVYRYFSVMDSADTIRNAFFSAQKDSLHRIEVAKSLYFNETYIDTIWNDIRKVRLYDRGKYRYSDLSFFLLKAVFEKIEASRLEKYLDKHFYEPMGLRTIGYLPKKRFHHSQITPTERDFFFRKQEVHGYVHDPTAALFGGVGGHAGLFSNAHDLGVLMHILLNNGSYGGKQYFKPSTIEKFIRRVPGTKRALGFDMQSVSPGKHKLCAASASSDCYGHTGFTGTCVWVDPKYGLVYVFLSNRVSPSARNWKISNYAIRQRIQEVIYHAMGVGENPEKLLFTETIPDSLVSPYDSGSIALAATDTSRKRLYLP